MIKYAIHRYIGSYAKTNAAVSSFFRPPTDSRPGKAQAGGKEVSRLVLRTQVFGEVVDQVLHENERE